MMEEHDDKNHILELVKKKKQRARDLNLLKISEDLYDHLKYLHIKFGETNILWKQVVHEAKCVHDELHLKKINIKMMNGNHYTIIYNDKNKENNIEVRNDCIVSGGHEFIVYQNDQKVLGVLFQCESDNDMPFNYYKAVDIMAFREGTWIQDFFELHQIERRYTESLLSKIDKEKIKRLKEDFDIE